jgi:hypothetical protein
MMVMPTTVVDLETLRARLHAEAARIRSEYETRLPDIEGDLAALDRIMSRMPVLSIAEPATIAPVETSTATLAPGAPPDADLAPAESVGPDPTAAPEASASPRVTRGPNWKRELAGLNQSQAVIKIAERTGGTMTPREAARILIEVGLSQVTLKAAAKHACHVLSVSDRIERVRKGVYRLRIQSEPSTTEPADVTVATCQTSR